MKCVTMTIDCNGGNLYRVETPVVSGKDINNVISMKETNKTVLMQNDSYINYLNKPKRASHLARGVITYKATESIDSSTDQIQQHTSAKHVLKMCDDRSNLSVEMNYQIATGRLHETCGCTYRSKVCLKHAVCVRKTLPFLKIPLTSSGSKIRCLKKIKFVPFANKLKGVKFVTPHTTVRYVANCSRVRLKNTFGVSACPVSTKRLDADSVPEKPKVSIPNSTAQKPKVLLNRSINGRTIDKKTQLYSSNTNVTKNEVYRLPALFGRSNFSVQRWAKKRLNDTVPLQISKRCRVDVYSVCHCKSIPDPLVSSNLGTYVNECLEHHLRRMIAAKMLSLFCPSTLGNNKKCTVVVLPQDLKKHASAWISQLSDIIGMQSLLRIYRFNAVCSGLDLTHDSWQRCVEEKNERAFASESGKKVTKLSETSVVAVDPEVSRKSNRLKRKKGLQSRYNADFFVEMPVSKKAKKLKLSGPYGSRIFWEFYKKKLSGNSLHKTLCHEYISFLQKKMYRDEHCCGSSSSSTTDVTEIFGRIVTSVECPAEYVFSGKEELMHFAIWCFLF